MIQGSGFRIWGLLLVPGSGLGGFVWVLGLGIVLGSGIGGCSGFGGCTPTVTTARATDERLYATMHITELSDTWFTDLGLGFKFRI